MVKTWFEVFSQCLWLAGILGGSLGVGRALLRRLSLTSLQPVTELTLGTGLGLSLLSYLVFTLAACQALSHGSILVLTGLWSLAIALNFRLPMPALFNSEKPIFKSPWAWGLLSVFLIHVILNTVSALTPAWDWDGVAYHLALPKLYLAHGGFIFRPDIYHNLFPQLTEMLYTLGLIFPWGSASKLIHLSFGILAAFALYALGRERQWTLAALLGATLFYIQYLVHIESGTAFIDLATTAYVGFTALALQQALRPDAPPRWLYFAAFMAGNAAATKWHGLIVLFLVCLLLGLHALRTPALRRVPPMLLIFLFGALPVLPYLARAWLQSGNPIWPLGYSLFGGAYWDAAIDQQMTANVALFAGTIHGWRGLLRLPYDLVAHGQAFGVGGHELRYPLLGGLALIAARLFYARTIRAAAPQLASPWRWFIGSAAMFFLLIWFFSSPQIRYLLPLGWLAIFGMVMGARSLGQLPQRGAKACALLAIALVCLVHPPVHQDTLGQIKTVLGITLKETFLQEKLNHYAACRYLNQHAAKSERILLFQENRGFYLDGDYLWGDPLNQAFINYRLLPTPEALGARLQALGIRWVLYRTGAFEAQPYYTPELLARMDQWLAAHGREVFNTQGVRVYRLSN